ncbi:MAG: hypothetical protein KKA28_10030, partial [Planctomycetes bacterium]|nr:hypothetical protein [Planctomycetota bacterium]
PAQGPPASAAAGPTAGEQAQGRKPGALSSRRRAWMPEKLRGMDAPAAVVTGWRGVSGLGSSDGWNQGGGGAP